MGSALLTSKCSLRGCFLLVLYALDDWPQASTLRASFFGETSLLTWLYLSRGGERIGAYKKCRAPGRYALLSRRARGYPISH
jgi:hypothetical protein